jgi:hypothetical protein
VPDVKPAAVPPAYISIPGQHSQLLQAAVASLCSVPPAPEPNQSGVGQVPSLDPPPLAPPRHTTVTAPAPAPGPLPEPVAVPLKPAPRRSKRLAAPSPGEPAGPARKRPAHSGNVTPVNPFRLQSDRLGTLVRSLVHDLNCAESWEGFVETFRGRSYLADDLERTKHPAIPLLREWRDHGVPAQTSAEPWSTSTLDSYVERGCHRSATDHAPFL